MLKPGMTANVTIVTANRDNVLRVPIQAIRFSPRRKGSSQEESAAQRAKPAAGQRARVWTIDDRGKLSPVQIGTGLDDGNFVEVVEGDLNQDDEAVTGENRQLGQGGASHGPLSG